MILIDPLIAPMSSGMSTGSSFVAATNEPTNSVEKRSMKLALMALYAFPAARPDPKNRIVSIPVSGYERSAHP
jgi:hypothetical protein